MKKIIILDFGNVIAHATTNNWHITPKFIELVDISNISKDKIKQVLDRYSYLLSEKLITLEEELDMFTRYYENILRDLEINNYKELSKIIAYDRTYKDSKYTLYPDIYNELDELSKKYKIVLLTDNWPCIIPYLERNNLDKYFDKVYISSVYQEVKKDKVFFNYPINEYNLDPKETIFIDDNEEILDVAKEIGFITKRMDRNKEVIESKHEIINDLKLL